MAKYQAREVYGLIQSWASKKPCTLPTYGFIQHLQGLGLVVPYARIGISLVTRNKFRPINTQVSQPTIVYHISKVLFFHIYGITAHFFHEWLKYH